MDEDKKFIFRMTLVIAIALVVVIGIVQLRVAQFDYVYAHLIADSADPMNTACALDARGWSVNPTCTIYWQNK